MARRKIHDPAMLVEAAAKLFRRKGYQNTTIDDLAAVVGISKPTVYQHVKNKGSLLEAIFDTVLSRVEQDQGIALASSDNPAEQLHQTIIYRVQAVTELQTYFMILMTEELELTPRVRRKVNARIHESNIKFADLLARCVPPDKARKDINVHTEALLILGMVSAMPYWYKPRGPLSAEQIAEHIMAIIGGYLAGHTK